MKFVLRLVCIWAISALCHAVCPNTEAFNSSKDYFPNKATVQYSQNMKIEYFGYYKVLTVSGLSKPSTIRYVMVQCNTKTPPADVTADAVVITIPIETVTSLMTPMTAMVTALGLGNSVKAVSDVSLYADPVIQQQAANNGLTDVYNATTFDVSVTAVLKVNANVVLTGASGFGNSDFDTLRQNGVDSVVVIGEVKERTGLGRAEWVKAVALLYNSEDVATQLFNVEADGYSKAARLATGVTYRPRVLFGRPYGAEYGYTEETWFPPGGQSYMAAMAADAGANYVFASTNATGTLSLPLAQVLAVGNEAEMWVNPDYTTWTTLDQAAQELNGSFAAFPSVKCGRVYQANKGAGFFEAGVVYPHLVLLDFVKIFHPTLNPAPFTFTVQYAPMYPTAGAMIGSSACALPQDTNTTSTTNSEGGSGLSGGAIAGIVIGCTVGVGIIVAAVAYFVGFRRGYQRLDPSNVATSHRIDTV